MEKPPLINYLSTMLVCSRLQENIVTAQANGKNDLRIVQTFNYTGDFASAANEDPGMWRDRLQVRLLGRPLEVAAMGANCKDGEIFFKLQMP